MTIDLKHKAVRLAILAIVVVSAFFALRYIYSQSSGQHCNYIAREVSDLGTPEKVCPRVCKRHGLEYDTSFSYLSQKLGTQCACCSGVPPKSQTTPD